MKLPFIDVIQYYVGTCFAVSVHKIFTYPCDKMILKGAFDDLMKEVRSKEFVYIRTWKSVGKWLQKSK